MMLVADLQGEKKPQYTIFNTQVCLVHICRNAHVYVCVIRIYMYIHLHISHFTCLTYVFSSAFVYIYVYTYVQMFVWQSTLNTQHVLFLLLHFYLKQFAKVKST